MPRLSVARTASLLAALIVPNIVLAQIEPPPVGIPSQMVGRWHVESINGMPTVEAMVLELASDGTVYVEMGGVQEPGGTWAVVESDGQTYLRQAWSDGSVVDNTLTMFSPERISLLSPGGDLLMFVLSDSTVETPETVRGTLDPRFVGSWTLTGLMETPDPFPGATLQLEVDGTVIATTSTDSQNGTWLGFNRDGLDHIRLSVGETHLEAACVWVSQDQINLITATSDLYMLLRQP